MSFLRLSGRRPVNARQQGMIRELVGQTKPYKPPVGEVHLRLAYEAPNRDYPRQHPVCQGEHLGTNTGSTAIARSSATRTCVCTSLHANFTSSRRPGTAGAMANEHGERTITCLAAQQRLMNDGGQLAPPWMYNHPTPHVRDQTHDLRLIFWVLRTARRQCWICAGILCAHSAAGRTAVTSISTSHWGLASPATSKTDRTGRFGCSSVPKNCV